MINAQVVQVNRRGPTIFEIEPRFCNNGSCNNGDYMASVNSTSIVGTHMLNMVADTMFSFEKVSNPPYPLFPFGICFVPEFYYGMTVILLVKFLDFCKLHGIQKSS